MELLAEAEAHGQGRYIITPRKGARFLGPSARAQARARERRRRVFVFLLESIGLTLLMGLVPPLRAMWIASGVLSGLLLLYVWLLVSIKQRGPRTRARERAEAAAAPRHRRAAPARERYVAGGRSAHARPSFNGLGSFAESDLVNIVVRPAREVGIAGA